MVSRRVAFGMVFGCFAVAVAAACGSSVPGDGPDTGDGGSNVDDASSGDGGGGRDGSSSTEDGGGDAGRDGSADGSANDGSTGDGGDAGTCAATEVCDGVVDDNCSGVVDEGCGRCPLLQTACATGCCAVDRWQVDTAQSGYGSSIAVDAAGNIFFAYTRPNPGVWTSALAVYDAVPGTWRTVNLGTGTYRNRVLLDALGRVHVLYATFSGNYAIFYARSDDKAQTFTPGVHVGNLAIGATLDMAIDSLNQPHVVYGGTRSGTSFPNLTYTHFDGTNWVKEVLDPTTLSPDEPELKLGFMDRPHIVVTAYHPDGQDNTSKRHVFYNGNRWIYENLDTAGAGSSYGSGYFSGHSLRLPGDGSAEVLFTRANAGTRQLYLSRRGPAETDTWTTSPITGVTNFDVPTLFLDDKGRRAAVSSGISLHRENTLGVWTTTALGIPGNVVAQARRGRYLYLGYSDPSNSNRPTVSFVDLGP